MNLQELKAVIEEREFRRESYSLNGELRDDTLCIDHVHGTWLVYYAERGKRWNERSFLSESEACKYFLDLISTDSDTRP